MRILSGVAVMVKFLIVYGCLLQSCSEPADYKEIKEFRKLKDFQFKTGANSPIPRFKQSYFGGLNYYEPDSLWKLNFQNKLLDRKDTVRFKVSDNITDVYVKAVMLYFTKNGKKDSLIALDNVAQNVNTYFIPFMDETSGKSTYSGGRYIDVVKESNFIDFNFSYNPFCAYNENYLCFPPLEENYVDMEITAGEKNYE